MFSKLVKLAAATIALASAGSSQLLAARSASAADVVIAIAEPQSSNASAMFRFIRTIGGDGLELGISVSGLEAGASYPFHIHTDLVPSDGNCTATGGHLDPHGIKKAAGDNYKCSADDAIKTCELGDLSGQLGPILAGSDGTFVGNFNVSTLDFGGEHTILDHSIVIHNSKGDRIACANIIGYVLGGEPASAAGMNERSMESMDDEPTTTNSSSGNLLTASVFSSALLAVAAAAFF
ncbi:hypothetical protein LPJ78_003543 [Coemansia sp. RSA 989]|nr:hypothetical protein LPJ68_003239 [Coemansia sp. RSA 1086]KAJ1749911.1 hypothetical protein LPJ79_003348 [Coemansia sp. RSA 1821]KAJ1864198.1 hypothetical protein LPJ78_003543 [Coemansia sp. RSA 989]KAJ1872117.1 hypothetical protein LPJ55_003356 [Coemansia sp. RSA 990]KAJ2633504.1 hypothetical protein H4R22_000407 [Coemansia sp. RSA 1290]KAJ2650821.1 hypothetical protein IWW40_002083 [Coemansia sp. RSA 1250]KAJ2669105.1 hypothetical protein IWW42_004793 [Coemansia sp. RSA 1085]